MNKLISLALASITFLACAPIYGDAPSAPSEERASSSGGEASAVPSNPIEAGRRLAQLEQQVRAGEETHQRLSDIARRATEEATRLRQQATAAATQPPPPAPTAPTPQPTAAPPMMGGVPGMGLGSTAIQNPGVPVMVPPYGVVNNMAWVGRPSPSQMVGGDVPYIELRVSGGARYATVITARDGTLICPSIATAIVTVGRRQLCAVPAGPSWRAVVETHSPGRHEFVVYYYRMNSYSGQGHLVNPGGTVVAGDTETYPNVDLP